MQAASITAMVQTTWKIGQECLDQRTQHNTTSKCLDISSLPDSKIIGNHVFTFIFRLLHLKVLFIVFLQYPLSCEVLMIITFQASRNNLWPIYIHSSSVILKTCVSALVTGRIYLTSGRGMNYAVMTSKCINTVHRRR